MGKFSVILQTLTEGRMIDIDVSWNNATIGGCCRCQHGAAVNTWDARDKTSHDWVIAEFLDLTWAGAAGEILPSRMWHWLLHCSVRSVCSPLHFNSREREEVPFSGERKRRGKCSKEEVQLEYKQVVCGAQEEVDYRQGEKLLVGCIRLIGSVQHWALSQIRPGN